MRGLLILLRSVPEIVWALLFVRAVGLGPTAGVLAIAITYAGMLGKVYAEIFESVDPRPTRALLAGVLAGCVARRVRTSAGERAEQQQQPTDPAPPPTPGAALPLAPGKPRQCRS